MPLTGPPDPAFLILVQPSARLRRLGFALALVWLSACANGPATMPMTAPGTASPTTRAQPAELERHVRHLTERCSPRDWEHPQGLESAARHVAEAFRSSGGRVSEQSYELNERTYRNVLAAYGPEGGPRIVVGAHYDTCGPLPGADDNASGIAGLLELGRLLGQAAPAIRVDLVAYSLEEPPFFRTPDMGSARHARWLRESGVEVRGVIILEMIGRFTDAKGSQSYPSFLLKPFYPSRGNFAAVVGRFGDLGLTRAVKRAMLAATPLPVCSINGPRWIPGLDFSDHHPYWDQGFTAVMVTDTSFYRNQDYHTEKDTADLLDYPRMAQVVEGVHAAVVRLGIQAH